jgi:hypothetical protein
MRDFTERVNARLPVDKPDAVLLALVQGEKGEVCGPKCDGGRCRQDAVAARTDERAEPVEAAPAKPAPLPAIVPPAPKAAAPPAPPPAAAAPPAPPSQAPAAAGERPERAGQEREPRTTQAAPRQQRRASRRTPVEVRYARSVFRTLRRAASLGLPFP